MPTDRDENNRSEVARNTATASDAAVPLSHRGLAMGCKKVSRGAASDIRKTRLKILG